MSKKAGKTVQFLRGLVLMPADAVTHAQNLEHAVNRLEEENERLAEALSHIKWIKDCGIDSSQGNHPDEERDAMYKIAKAALAQREKDRG